MTLNGGRERPVHGGGHVRGSVTRRPSVRAAATRASDTTLRVVLTAAEESGCQQGLYGVSGVLLKRSRSIQPPGSRGRGLGPFPRVSWHSALLCSRWAAETGRFWHGAEPQWPQDTCQMTVCPLDTSAFLPRVHTS